MKAIELLDMMLKWRQDHSLTSARRALLAALAIALLSLGCGRVWIPDGPPCGFDPAELPAGWQRFELPFGVFYGPSYLGEATEVVTFEGPRFELSAPGMRVIADRTALQLPSVMSRPSDFECSTPRACPSSCAAASLQTKPSPMVIDDVTRIRRSLGDPIEDIEDGESGMKAIELLCELEDKIDLLDFQRELYGFMLESCALIEHLFPQEAVEALAVARRYDAGAAMLRELEEQRFKVEVGLDRIPENHADPRFQGLRAVAFILFPKLEDPVDDLDIFLEYSNMLEEHHEEQLRLLVEALDLERSHEVPLSSSIGRQPPPPDD